MQSLSVARLIRLWPGALWLVAGGLLALLVLFNPSWWEPTGVILLAAGAAGAAWLWVRNRQYRDTLEWATTCLQAQRYVSAMPLSQPRLVAVRQFRAALRSLLYGQQPDTTGAVTNTDNVASLPARQVHQLARVVVDIQQDLELQQAMLELLERCLEQDPGLVRQFEEGELSLQTVADVLEELAQQTDQIALNAAIEAARSEQSSRSVSMVTRETGSLAWKIRQYVNEISLAVQRRGTARQVDQNILALRQETAEQVLGILRQLREISRQTETRLDQLRKTCSGLAEQFDLKKESPDSEQ